MQADDESTIKMLRTSKVMNRDQISIREVIHESEPDGFIQSTEFDAAENANTQNFMEMRELVAQGLSIMHIIQNEDFTPMVTGDFNLSLCQFVMFNDIFFSIKIRMNRLMKRIVHQQLAENGVHSLTSTDV